MKKREIGMASKGYKSFIRHGPDKWIPELCGFMLFMFYLVFCSRDRVFWEYASSTRKHCARVMLEEG